MQIGSWIIQAQRQLQQVEVSSPRLDAELLAGLATKRGRAWLLAHLDDALTPKQLQQADHLLTRRTEREPLAYLRGTQEFYGREFLVSPAVLIPRPETEMIITLLKKIAPALPDDSSLLDIGTGSGAIGITAKLELPHLRVTLSDLQADALEVARHNATALKASVTFCQSDLLAAWSHKKEQFHFIIANLPYVGSEWDVSPETHFEPSHALFAQDEGLALILSLIEQVPATLAPEGLLLLEADPRQHSAIVQAATAVDLTHLVTQDFVVVFKKTASYS